MTRVRHPWGGGRGGQQLAACLKGVLGLRGGGWQPTEAGGGGEEIGWEVPLGSQEMLEKKTGHLQIWQALDQIPIILSICTRLSKSVSEI